MSSRIESGWPHPNIKQIPLEDRRSFILNSVRTAATTGSRAQKEALNFIERMLANESGIPFVFPLSDNFPLLPGVGGREGSIKDYELTSEQVEAINENYLFAEFLSMDNNTPLFRLPLINRYLGRSSAEIQAISFPAAGDFSTPHFVFRASMRADKDTLFTPHVHPIAAQDVANYGWGGTKQADTILGEANQNRSGRSEQQVSFQLRLPSIEWLKWTAEAQYQNLPVNSWGKPLQTEIWKLTFTTLLDSTDRDPTTLEVLEVLTDILVYGLTDPFSPPQLATGYFLPAENIYASTRTGQEIFLDKGVVSTVQEITQENGVWVINFLEFLERETPAQLRVSDYIEAKGEKFDPFGHDWSIHIPGVQLPSTQDIENIAKNIEDELTSVCGLGLAGVLGLVGLGITYVASRGRETKEELIALEEAERFKKFEEGLKGERYEPHQSPFRQPIV